MTSNQLSTTPLQEAIGETVRWYQVQATRPQGRRTENWVTTPTAAWLVAVALLASGVFGATLRWSALPWFAGTLSRARTFGLVANLAICALIIAVAFV